MKKILATVMATLALCAVGMTQHYHERDDRPHHSIQRIYLHQADPWFVIRMLDGRVCVMPEYSTIFIRL